MSNVLRTLPVKLDADERPSYQADSDARGLDLTRPSGSPPTLDVLDSLMAEVRTKTSGADWDDRARSDHWLAPRVHYSLRLHRAEAADRGVWQWVALRYPWYVEWRWAGQDGQVADDRWWGPVHKQAFARLWWGASLPGRTRLPDGAAGVCISGPTEQLSTPTNCQMPIPRTRSR